MFQARTEGLHVEKPTENAVSKKFIDLKVRGCKTKKKIIPSNFLFRSQSVKIR